MSIAAPSKNLLRLTTNIVAAHIARNSVPSDELSDLIRSVYAALSTAGTPTAPEIWQQPAVPVKKSVFTGYIVCLEDGKKMKMLKRYLQTNYAMTPDAYRAKWNLPTDYPMVAPDYAARRSTLARESGLGRKPVTVPVPVVEVAASDEPEVIVQHIPAGKRGRKPGSKKAAHELVNLATD